jgi:hypothetical protein
MEMAEWKFQVYCEGKIKGFQLRNKKRKLFIIKVVNMTRVETEGVADLFQIFPKNNSFISHKN